MNRLSNFLRALLLVSWLYSLLIWLYVAVRIITNDHIVFDPFIYDVPGISFGMMGAGSFIFSALCLLIYLTVWGLPQRPRCP